MLWQRRWDSALVPKCAESVPRLGCMRCGSAGNTSLKKTLSSRLRRSVLLITFSSNRSNVCVLQVLKKNQEGNTSVNKLFS